MLPEPDLFSSVNANCRNPASSLYHLWESRRSSLKCEPGNPSVQGDSATVSCEAENSTPLHKLEGLTHTCESDGRQLPVQNIKSKCHPYNWCVKSVLSKERRANTNSGIVSLDPSEATARRWYLTVIVLLYVGLITSFCLNVSLLLKSYPEPAASGINLSPQQFGLDELGGN